MLVCRCLVSAVLSVFGAGSVALAAEGEGDAPPGARSARAAVEEGMFLPSTLAARVGTNAAMGAALGGYDGAVGKPLMSATAEVRIWGPLAIRGGVLYSNAREAMRPLGGVRAQVLRQERHGIDGAIAVFYRAEGFTEPEGEIETIVSLARSWDRLMLVGNLVYGQDPEGRERDVETRLGFLRRDQVTVGIDSRMRLALKTKTAANQAEEPRYDVLAGPVVATSWGPLSFVAQAGPSLLKVSERTHFGMAALGGVGTVF